MHFEYWLSLASFLSLSIIWMRRRQGSIKLASRFVELKASQDPSSGEKIIVHLRSLTLDRATLSTKRADLQKGTTLFLDLSPFCSSFSDQKVLLQTRVASASPLQSDEDSCLLRVLFKPQSRPIIEQFRRYLELH